MAWRIIAAMFGIFGPSWKKPPKCQEDQVTAEDIFELLGVPHAIAVSQFYNHICRSAVAVCSDDELVCLPGEAISDTTLRRLFGENSYSEGSFQSSLRKMMEEYHPGWQKGLQAFQAKIAVAWAAQVAKGALAWQVASTNLVDDTLLFDANLHSYSLPPLSRPRVLMDYGPGLGGRFVIREHINAQAKGRPFIYVPVTNGYFIPAFLLGFASTLMTKESMAVYMNNGLFAAEDKGIRAATNRLIQVAPAQVDVIFCSGLQMINKQELRAGIENAFTLLRDGGILLIRSQRNREPAESSTVDDMLEIAYASGFSRKTSRFFESISGDPRLGKTTPTLAAILTKG